jgi:hypothetical protein
MAIKLIDIAAAYNRHVATTGRHIKELIEKGKFKKESPGKQYNREEVRKLEELMCFKFREQK